MKNRLKEFRLKRRLTPTALAKAIEFKGVKFTKQQILAAETGEPDGFDLDLLFKASGKLRVPFHKMLYIPIDGYSEISKKVTQYAWHARFASFWKDGSISLTRHRIWNK